MPKVFVYGSLKKGFANHGILSNAKFIGKYVTEPSYTMYDLGAYPSITLDGDTSIHGEVYEVDDLYRLDVLEGCPDYYQRIEIKTKYGLAWVYYYEPKFAHGVIASGEWHVSSKSR